VMEEPELGRILGPKVTPARPSEPDEPIDTLGAWGESHA